MDTDAFDSCTNWVAREQLRGQNEELRQRQALTTAKGAGGDIFECMMNDWINERVNEAWMSDK